MRAKNLVLVLVFVLLFGGIASINGVKLHNEKSISSYHMGLKKPVVKNGNNVKMLTENKYEELIKHAPMYEGRKRLIATIPQVIPSAVANTEYLPPVGNQGQQGSCNGWASAYYTYTYMQYWFRGEPNPTQEDAMSPAFTYNLINNGTDSGSWPGDSGVLFTTMGVVPWRDMPYTDTDYTTWPNETQYLEAMHYRAGTWYALNIAWGNDENFTELKNLLAAGYVAETAILVYDDYYYITSEDNNIYAENETHSTLEGGHAQTIIGYNDSISTPDGPGAFRVVNSWGTSWGDNGFYWLSYVAARGSKLSYQWVWIFVPRSDPANYTPEIISYLKIQHDKRGEILGGLYDSTTDQITVPAGFVEGAVVDSNPIWSERFFNFSIGYYTTQSSLSNYQAYPFPNSSIALDLTDSLGILNKYADNWKVPFFVNLRDKVDDGDTGTLQNFTVEIKTPYLFEEISNSTLTEIPENGNALVASVDVPIVNYGNDTPPSGVDSASESLSVDIGAVVNLTGAVLNLDGVNHTMNEVNPNHFVLQVSSISPGWHTYRVYISFENGNTTVLPERTYHVDEYIKIDNDRELENMATNSSWMGNGTANNPYVISNFTMSGHSAEYGIYIGNTTKYVIIKDVNISGVTQHSNFYEHGDAITLYNTTNIKIENATLTNSDFGIFIYLSHNITVEKCGNFSDNDYYGIEIYKSYGIRIINNSFSKTSGNLSALAIIHSSYNVIYMNSFNDNTIYLWGGKDTFTTQTIPENNSVNGGLVMYYKNADLNGVSFPAYATEIILGNVSNAMVSGVNGIAFEAGYSRNVTLENSGFQDGKVAVYMENLENAKIYSNNLSDSMVGLAAYNVNNSVIENNKVYSTYWGDGVYLNESSWNKISGNVVSGSAYVGIDMEQSSNNTLSDNILTANNYDNLFLYKSNYNIVENNNLSESKEYHGIGVDLSDGNKIMNNTVWGNKRDGIWIGNSENNEISGNRINCNDIGVYITSSNKNTFVGNVLSNNTGYGVQIESGSYNRVYNNSFLLNHGSSGRYDVNNVQALDNGTYNYWNTTSGYGNYWYDWANNNDTNDKNGDGIVDWPYKIDGTAGAEDYYPLTAGNAAVPEFNGLLAILLVGLLLIGILRRRCA